MLADLLQAIHNSTMSFNETMFNESFDLETAISATRERGYYFAGSVLTETMRKALEEEVDSLPLEVGEHISRPINRGKPNQVQQQHERLYVPYGDLRTPIANLAIQSLTDVIKRTSFHSELKEWQLNEIGYQRYRHP